MDSWTITEIFIISLLLLWSVYKISTQVYRQLTKGEEEAGCENCGIKNHSITNIDK